MNYLDEQVFVIWEKYQAEWLKIRNNPDLSGEGKRKALVQLSNKTLAQYEDLHRKIKEHERDLTEELMRLEATDPRRKPSEEEVAQEQRVANLIVSKAAAATDGKMLLVVAEEAARKDPAGFLLSYANLVRLLDPLAPRLAAGPWDPWKGAGEPVIADTGRTRLFTELQGYYDTAAAAVVTPGELKLKERLEAIHNSLSGYSASRSLLQRLENKITVPEEWPVSVE
ncbi:MAG: hypothetical protein AB1767_06980 [Bacillota bacterium]